jgi:ribosomal-protein-alanine N-acetyltransferase
MWVVCETERLILRRLTMDDLEPLAAIHADAEVMQFVGGARTYAQTRDRLRDLIDAYETVGFSKWAVVHRASGAFIGRCGPILERISGVDEVEVGYDLAKSYWGQGLASEAAAAARRRVERDDDRHVRASRASRVTACSPICPRCA